MRAALLRLQQIVGADAFVADPGSHDPRLTDERGIFHGAAAAIVMPGSTTEVSELVATCAEARIPIVPQGGNTGYCGAATPDASGRAVLISLARLNRIRAIDVNAATLTAEAGVILENARDAADGAGMLLPLGMGSQGSCQLGGNLSTNAGGLSVLRYGTARELVAGLEVVLPDGQIFSDLRGLRKDNTGYDLKQLFMGAEGTLGVITAAVLRLAPRPRFYLTAWIAVATIDAALALLATVRGELGDCITSFEYIAHDALALTCANLSEMRAPIDDHPGAHVLIELAAFDDGTALTAAFERTLAAALESAAVIDVATAQSEAHRRAFWSVRESVPAAEKRAGGSVKHDVSVSLGALPRLSRLLTARVATQFPGARVSEYGHVGDGNLHFNVLAPADTDAGRWREAHAVSVSNLVHETAIELGGSFSAEHGVGQLKRDLLAQTASPIALALMRELKQALDPLGLMNPGKVL